MADFDKPAFVTKELKDDSKLLQNGAKDTEQPITVRLNEDERLMLNKSKKLLEQEKDSTALKTLAWIGAKVIHEEKILYLLGTIFKNKRNNKRIGIIEFEN